MSTDGYLYRLDETYFCDPTHYKILGAADEKKLVAARQKLIMRWIPERFWPRWAEQVHSFPIAYQLDRGKCQIRPGGLKSICKNAHAS